MPLIDTIRAAAASLDADDTRSVSKLPVFLDASVFLPFLKPQSSESPVVAAPIHRLSGWDSTLSSAKANKSLEKLVKKLRRKLKKNDAALDRVKIIRLIDSLTEQKHDAASVGQPVEVVVEACVRLELWERLENLILEGFVKGNGAFGLVEKLVKNNQAGLLCVSARCIHNLRPTDMVAILRFFLNPTRDSREGMLNVRKEWERQGLLAIEKVSEHGLNSKKLTFAKEVSIMLMMAHDGFTSWELCLHHVFSCQNAEGLVMSTAISMLHGVEVMRLINYFQKWLEKYERFPEAVICSKTKVPMMGLVAHERVPSLVSVVNGLAMVLDVHFSYLVLNPKFHQLLMSIKNVVKSLASAAVVCRLLANVLENSPSQ